MARMRMVKPEMRKSLTVSSWPIPVRWTFVGLIGYVDDEGRGLDELRLLKAELYPLDDDMTAKKIGSHLATLVDRGPLCRYTVDGLAYLHFTSWSEHQRVSHPTPSRIPPCPTHDKLASDSRTAPEDDGTVPPRAGAGARGSGNREQGSMAPVAPIRERDEIFDAVVQVCQLEAASLTKASRGEVNAVVKQLREVDATPSQIKARAVKYRQRYPSSTLTPSALAKHWAGLAASNGGRDVENDDGWFAR